MIPETLITYIETAIIPRYKEFDKAHNLSHVRTVIEESLALARQYPEADERLAYVIAAYHDTGLCRDRATHHLVSGEILMADSTLRQWFSDTEILLMKEAVEDHRASTDHEPRSIYGKIVAEADRIIDPDITLRRTVQYGLKQNPAADKECSIACCLHRCRRDIRCRERLFMNWSRKIRRSAAEYWLLPITCI